MTQTLQGALQAAIRSALNCANDFNGDLHAMCDMYGITAGPISGRLIPAASRFDASITDASSALNYFLQNPQNACGTLALDFTTATSLDPRITFSRGSQATLFDSTGALVYAKHNLLLQSQTFDVGANWAATNLTVSADTTETAAPDGTFTAEKLTVTGGSAAHAVAQSLALAVATYTVSIFVKKGTQFYFRFGRNTGTSIPAPGTWWWDVDAGTFNGTLGSGWTNQSITHLGNGWYRCSVSVITTAAGTDGFSIALTNNAGNNIFSADNNTFYIWGAQLNQTPMEGGVTSSLSTYYPTVASAYYAPRFDYNPSTLAAQGLLIEEQRTNSIRNNTMQGAVAGTPGTLPNNWAATTLASGLSRQIVGTGTEDGITYADIRYSGTATGTSNISVAFEATNQIAAAPSQMWANSVYVTVSAGTLPENFFISVHEFDSSNAFLRSNDVSRTSGLTSSLKTSRQSQSITTGASTAFVRPLLYFTFTNGQVVDITLRIGLPQLEQGAFATSVIPTTTTALTRNADVASMTGTNFSSWYNAAASTLYVEWTNIAATMPSGATQVVASINDGSAGNQQSLFQLQSALSKASANMLSASVNPGRLDTGGAYSNATVKAAAAYAALDRALSVNGGVAVTSTAGSLPISVTRIDIANSFATNFLNGYIRRISYYPVRLGNSTLQALTA